MFKAIISAVLFISIAGSLYAVEPHGIANGCLDPAECHQWFRKLMQPDYPQTSCCGEADAFITDEFEVDGDHYVVTITDGLGVIPDGTKIPVPREKLKWDQGNPTGHGIIFISTTGTVYCWCPPAGI